MINLFKIIVTAFCLAAVLLLGRELFWGNQTRIEPPVIREEDDLKIIEDYIEKNEYSRPGLPLKKVKGIVVHYVANPGSTAKENRDYFNGLKDTHTRKASSHFVIGIDGEIIQCIPLNEISYASNQRNKDTISIECCHKKEDGKFSEATYASLLALTAWLCDHYALNSRDVIRHYDVTGKLCPLYFVEHEDAWKDFIKAVQSGIENRKNKENLAK